MSVIRQRITIRGRVGNRHHFVPRFYLSAFASDSRRINLFNFARSRTIVGASLRDQCYAHRLYGSDEIEGALAQLEGVAATTLKEVRDREVVPGAGTFSREVLTTFLGFQLARTTAARARAVQFSQLLADVAFKGTPPKGTVSTADEAILMMLASAPVITETIADLAFTLVVAPAGECFITSDDPAVKYNTYCEGITDAGVTGTKSCGFQIFFPVSPRFLLLCFDPAVYKIVRRSSRLIDATPADVASLNRLQLVNAEENVYFSDPALGDWVRQAATSARETRILKPQIIRAVEEGNERSELLHEFWPMPQLNLQLSFLTIRRAARNVDLFDRAHQFRKPHRQPEQRDRLGETSRRFEVRSRH